MQKMCITPAELRKALKAIEQCEANGFNASLAVLRLDRVEGPRLSDVKVTFVDTWDRADNTSAHDWGRQGAAKRYRVVNGSLEPLVNFVHKPDPTKP